MFNAVLFDLDGTLLDTLEDLADAANNALVELGYPAHPVDAYRYFVGDGVKMEIIRALPAAHRDESTILKCVELTRKYYTQCWADKTRPYPGVTQLLDELQKRNISMVVFSNKPDKFTQILVEKILADWKFDVVLGAKDGVPRKPDPMVPLQIAEKLGIPAGKFLYLGDTDTDMMTANAAGMYPVGALWGFRTAEELRTSGAKTLIKNPIQLLELL